MLYISMSIYTAGQRVFLRLCEGATCGFGASLLSKRRGLPKGNKKEDQGHCSQKFVFTQQMTNC